MNEYLISVTHPTARLDEGAELWWYHAMMAFFRACDDPQQVEYVLCIHESNAEQFLKQDIAWPEWGRTHVVVNKGPNTGNAQGSYAGKMATGKVLIGMMDDLFPPPHWDTLLLRALGDAIDLPRVVHVSSGSGAGDRRTFVPQVLTRARRDQIGYTGHPAYLSMYVDNEFTEVAIRDGIVIEAQHIEFDHRHFTFGKSKPDPVYLQQNDRRRFDADYQTFLARKKAGFPSLVDEAQNTGVPDRFDVKAQLGGLPDRQAGRPAENSSIENRSRRPRFSILHTSSRPHKWRAVWSAWKTRAKDRDDVEYVLVVDPKWGFETANPEKVQYRAHEAPYEMDRWDQLVLHPGGYQYSGYVQGVNLAAQHARGEILIVVADDQYPCDQWDVYLNELVGFADPAKTEFVIEVSTGTVQEHARGIFVMPILSRARYDRLHYVFYPAYESMYADNDLCEHARFDKVVVDGRIEPSRIRYRGPGDVFPHIHPLIPVESGRTKTVDPDKWDASYERQHDQGAYALGEFVLRLRRESGFRGVCCSRCGAEFGTEHLNRCDLKGLVKVREEGRVAPESRGSIAWCLPMRDLSPGWFFKAIELYRHFVDRGFHVSVILATSSACFVSREVVRQKVMQMSPRPDLLFWQDSDNPVEPRHFDRLLGDLEEFPDLGIVAGWYRLPPDRYGRIVTCAAQKLSEDRVEMIDERDLIAAAGKGLVETEWFGFGCCLMRYEALVATGDKPFAPIPAPASEWGATGEDTAFLLRARQNGVKIALDPSVFIPHIKLGEIGTRPVLSGLVYDNVKLSVQTSGKVPDGDEQLPSHERLAAIASKGPGTGALGDRSVDLRQVNKLDPPTNVGSDKPSPAMSPAQPYTRGRVVACLRIQDEGRWIAGVLRSLGGICDYALIVDNGSRDNARDEIQRAAAWASPGTILPEFRDSRTSDEGADRQYLLERARELGADWILNIDGDEELDPETALAIRRYLRDKPDEQAFALRIRYLWDGTKTERVDRWYKQVWFPRLFKVTPRLGFRSIKNGIHTTWLGLDSRNIFGVDAPGLWHYGYLLKEDRVAKWKHYNAIDPNNTREDLYRHIVQGDVDEVPSTAALRMAGPLELVNVCDGRPGYWIERAQDFNQERETPTAQEKRDLEPSLL